MPPVRLVVLRVPSEFRTPQRMSCPLFLKPESEKVTETVSASPTPRLSGVPDAVKKAQKASEFVPVAVTSKLADPARSVRTVVDRPLNSQREFLARS